MAILNIRRLSDDVHAALRLRAARNGRSMEAEARDILAHACTGDYQAAEGSSLVRDAADPGAPAVTVALPPQLAAAAKEFARRHATSVEELIVQLLDRELVTDDDPFCDRLFALMDEAGGDLKGWKWNRDELYRV
jgi:plasmid stability protein